MFAKCCQGFFFCKVAELRLDTRDTDLHADLRTSSCGAAARGAARSKCMFCGSPGGYTATHSSSAGGSWPSGIVRTYLDSVSLTFTAPAFYVLRITFLHVPEALKTYTKTSTQPAEARGFSRFSQKLARVKSDQKADVKIDQT